MRPTSFSPHPLTPLKASQIPFPPFLTKIERPSRLAPGAVLPPKIDAQQIVLQLRAPRGRSFKKSITPSPPGLTISRIFVPLSLADRCLRPFGKPGGATDKNEKNGSGEKCVQKKKMALCNGGCTMSIYRRYRIKWVK